MPAELYISFGPLKIELDHKITVVSETPKKYYGIITFCFQDIKIEGENMSASMVVGSYATLSVMWYDEDEHVSHGYGTTWASSDSATIPVAQASGNPLIANVQALKAGSATITASAFADESQTIPISATIEIAATTTIPPVKPATHGVISFTQYPGQIPGRK